MSLFKVGRRAAFAGLAALLIGGCGFQPLYGETTGGREILAQLARVRISPIADRAGQELRNQLLDRITPQGQPVDPGYRLDVLLTVSRVDLAIRKDEIATRANLVVSAGFVLLDMQTNQELFRGTSAITTSFDIVASEFATLTAERNALSRGSREISEDIRARLAVFMSRLPQRG